MLDISVNYTLHDIYILHCSPLILPQYLGLYHNVMAFILFIQSFIPFFFTKNHICFIDNIKLNLKSSYIYSMLRNPLRG